MDDDDEGGDYTEEEEETKVTVKKVKKKVAAGKMDDDDEGGDYTEEEEETKVTVKKKSKQLKVTKSFCFDQIKSIEEDFDKWFEDNKLQEGEEGNAIVLPKTYAKATHKGKLISECSPDEVNEHIADMVNEEQGVVKNEDEEEVGEGEEERVGLARLDQRQTCAFLKMIGSTIRGTLDQQRQKLRDHHTSGILNKGFNNSERSNFNRQNIIMGSCVDFKDLSPFQKFFATVHGNNFPHGHCYIKMPKTPEGSKVSNLRIVANAVFQGKNVQRDVVSELMILLMSKNIIIGPSSLAWYNSRNVDANLYEWGEIVLYHPDFKKNCVRRILISWDWVSKKSADEDAKKKKKKSADEDEDAKKKKKKKSADEDAKKKKKKKSADEDAKKSADEDAKKKKKKKSADEDAKKSADEDAKKKKKKKPKRNQGAFFHYSQATRADVKAAQPDLNFGQIAKVVSVNFEALSDEERAYWDKKAAADKERYQAEMAAYKGEA
ncbi:hypothetical protein ACHAWC_010722 [Mediolabrus comicus]